MTSFADVVRHMRCAVINFEKTSIFCVAMSRNGLNKKTKYVG